MKTATYVKMVVAGAVCIIGGPALTRYLMPTPDELFQRYNPELQKRSLENREKTEREHAEFLSKLREYSQSDKPIWVVAKEAEEREKKEKRRRAKEEEAEREAVRREIERERLGK